MNKMETAAKLYDDMLENYRNIMDDHTDIEQADRFLDAATALSAMMLPNPFADLAGSRFTVNAAVRPSAGERIITGVKE